MIFRLSQQIYPFMGPMRPTAFPFWHRVDLFPKNLAPKKKTVVAKGNDEAVWQSQQVAVLKPRTVVRGERFAFVSWLDVGHIVFMKALLIRPQCAVHETLRCPVDR